MSTPHNVIDLSEYRKKQPATRRRKAITPPSGDDKLIETITYYLLMAARAIEGRRKQ